MYKNSQKRKKKSVFFLYMSCVLPPENALFLAEFALGRDLSIWTIAKKIIEFW